LKQSIVVPQDVIFRVLEDEAVLLNLKTGTYFGLDAVGTRVWQLIVERGALADVLQAMLQEYEVDPGVVERDLLDLVGRLCAKGLAEVGPGN